MTEQDAVRLRAIQHGRGLLPASSLYGQDIDWLLEQLAAAQQRAERAEAELHRVYTDALKHEEFVEKISHLHGEMEGDESDNLEATDAGGTK